MKNHYHMLPRRKFNSGSITVEAALVLPVFVFAMYTFIFLIQVLYVQQEVQAGLQSTARYCEKAGYIYDYIQNYDCIEENKNAQTVQGEDKKENEDAKKSKVLLLSKRVVGKVITKEIVHSKFAKAVNTDILNKSCITNGLSGINFWLSNYNEDAFTIDIVAVYQVHLPLGFFFFQDFRCTQRCKVRVFVGRREVSKTEADKDSEDYVYITETGTVYHESKDCTYLKLSIKSLQGKGLKDARNHQGAKYYPCESCKPEFSESGIYYITSEGNRYHTSPNCSTLKRTIIKIKRSEIGGRKPCTRCTR